VIALLLTVAIPLISPAGWEGGTPSDPPAARSANEDGPAPLGDLRVDFVQSTLTIPAGSHHYIYFDRATSTLMEMPLPDNTAGLPSDALLAIDRTPDWLKGNLTRKFEQLADKTIDVGAYATPELADIDADGDLDLLVGRGDGDLQFFRNADGGLHYYEGMDVWVSAVYTLDATPFSGISVPGGFSDPALGDADLDGDLDLYVGSANGMVYAYENVGDASSPSWGPAQSTGISVGASATVDAVNLAGDGRVDLVVGAQDGTVDLYRNDGGGAYVLVTGYFAGVSVGGYANPALADMDDDGDLDLVLGGDAGGLSCYRNDGGLWTYVSTYFAGLPQPSYTAPLLADMTLDAIPDLVFGRFEGTMNYYPNYGSAATARWLAWTNPTTNYMVINHNNYYFDDSAVYLRERAWNQKLGDYAAVINQAPQEYVDELAFTIAHSSVAALTHPSVPTSGPSGVLDNLYYNNTDTLYFNDQFIDYADIVDYELGAPEQWSTVRYAVDNGGSVEWREYPRYVYYWYIVHPKGSDELATFIDPAISAGTFSGHEGWSPRWPNGNGYFWRYAAFNMASASYPPDPVSCPNSQEDTFDADGDGNLCRNYPTEENPPVLREKLAGVPVIWNLTTYSTPKIYVVNETENGAWARDAQGNVLRPWDYTDQAVERIGHWVGSTTPLHAQDSDEGNRPRQPVTIQWEHNGNCGEEGDMLMTGLRSALIPGRVLDGYGGDHCWAEFYDSGWHQFDTYWHGDTTIVANDDNYHYGWNRDWSGILTTRGDSRVINLVERYHHEGDDSNDTGSRYNHDPLNEGLIDRANVTVRVTDSAGNPVDGARVSVGDYVCYGGMWYSFGTIWYYTDSNGEARFATSEARQNVNNFLCDTSRDTFNDGIQIEAGSKMGSDRNLGYFNRYKPSYGDAFNARNAAMYYYNYSLAGTMPRPSPQGSPGGPVTPDRYRMEVSFSVDAGIQHPSNAQGVDDGVTYHDYEIYDGVHVDAFIASSSEVLSFMKDSPFQWYQSQVDAASGTMAFGIPDYEDWYVVLSNRDSLETAKKVTVSVSLFDTWTQDNSVAPPTDLRASLEGPGYADVQLSWTLSIDDGGGQNDVVAYDVYYGTAYDAGGAGYVLLGSTPAGAGVFTHSGGGQGDPDDYFYCVEVRDASGNANITGEQAGKFTRWLDAGMQLVSVPLELADWSLQGVLKTVDFSEAWTFDPGQGDPWASFSDAKVTNDLGSLNRGRGVWVDVRTAGYFTVAGAVLPQTTITLEGGWNLVGYPSFSGTYTVADLAADVSAERVEGYDPATGPYYLRELSPPETLQAGDAYWVKVPAATDWVVTL
jgi:hypothetical protein